MILHPSVLALLGSSLLVAGMLVHSGWWGAAVLRRWDLRSGSSRQLELERRTYLVSTLLGYVLVFELASLFLFVFTADGLAPLFTGAMCAAGSLKANGWGYPVLGLKLLGFVLAGTWLILNHADNLGEDYPLIRTKYAFLLALTPVLLAGAAMQASYFLGLRPEVITSCCGSLFGAGGSGLGAGLAALPAVPVAAAFVGLLAVAAAAAVLFLRTGRGAWVLGGAAALLLPASLAAVVSWISPYVYESPTHHCPFCILQREYGYVGYPIYAALLGATVLGAGVGVLQPFRSVPSLAVRLPALQRRLAAGALALLAVLGAFAAWSVLGSNLRM